MGHDTLVIIITVAISVPGASALTWLFTSAVAFTKLKRQDEVLGRRVGRLQVALPVVLNIVLELLDSFISVLKAVEEHKLNGEMESTRLKIEGARTEMREFLTSASMSQKDSK